MEDDTHDDSRGIRWFLERSDITMIPHSPYVLSNAVERLNEMIDGNSI